MTVIGLDDTDSRELGMCTTYLAARLADRLREAGATVERRLLVRLNPAVEHKTRGNAALAVHTDADPDAAFALARELVADAAETDDRRTNPGLVVASGDAGSADAVPDPVADFACEAVRDHLTIADAEACIDAVGYRSAGWKQGRGKIGALAAVGAWRAFDGADGEWTYECIAYREPARCGTQREVDAESVFDAASAAYPDAWDTVDRETGELVCVPHAPGPILHGIRGDDRETVESVSRAIESEPVERRATFVTNQGTDAHLRDADQSGVAIRDGRSYCVTGTVANGPETRQGGHVFLAVALARAASERDREEDASSASGTLRCAAFEPTKRFRDRVRNLRSGDRVTVCGEVSDGTLKLEKFAVRRLDRTELLTPDCPDCGRSMKSAGADQGYRCRDCKTSAAGKVEREVERDLALGWYEVPPEARRHISKPLVRGGFDAPTHPER